MKTPLIILAAVALLVGGYGIARFQGEHEKVTIPESWFDKPAVKEISIAEAFAPKSENPQDAAQKRPERLLTDAEVMGTRAETSEQKASSLLRDKIRSTEINDAEKALADAVLSANIYEDNYMSEAYKYRLQGTDPGIEKMAACWVEPIVKAAINISILKGGQPEDYLAPIVNKPELLSAAIKSLRNNQKKAAAAARNAEIYAEMTPAERESQEAERRHEETLNALNMIHRQQIIDSKP